VADVAACADHENSIHAEPSQWSVPVISFTMRPGKCGAGILPAVSRLIPTLVPGAFESLGRSLATEARLRL
jgi:hypothetical protein